MLKFYEKRGWRFCLHGEVHGFRGDTYQVVEAQYYPHPIVTVVDFSTFEEIHQELFEDKVPLKDVLTPLFTDEFKMTTSKLGIGAMLSVMYGACDPMQLLCLKSNEEEIIQIMKEF